MTRTGTMFAIAAALAIGATFGGDGLVQARLGTGGEAIGGTPEMVSAHTRANDASRSVGNCITNRTAYRTQSNSASTVSGIFAAMPNTHFPVTHNAGCLIVDFSGEVYTSSATTRMLIRAWIGGIGAAEPVFVFLGRPVAAGILEVRSMRFVFPNVPAGTHTVRIDWASSSGASVHVNRRTLTAQYR